MSRRLDLTGQRFGRWRVLELAESPGWYADAAWLCRCDCGTARIVRAVKLRIGHSRSCGCLRRDVTRTLRLSHQMSESRAYKSWAHMLDRCRNPKNKKYPRYGGRGITVCDHWRTSFANFYSDMGDPPPKYTLDRIDNDGPYTPGNCRWADAVTQNRSRRP